MNLEEPRPFLGQLVIRQRPGPRFGESPAGRSLTRRSSGHAGSPGLHPAPQAADPSEAQCGNLPGFRPNHPAVRSAIRPSGGPPWRWSKPWRIAGPPRRQPGRLRPQGSAAPGILAGPVSFFRPATGQGAEAPPGTRRCSRRT
jgi:hypothetical protein